MVSQNEVEVWGLLSTPSLQGLPVFIPMRPPVPQNLKRVSGHRHPALCNGYGSDRSGHRGNWHVGAGPCSIFLSGQQTSYIDHSREVAEVILIHH